MTDAARLDVFKALGDNTRYAVYLELARSPVPLATGEIAELLDLHVNTVRGHLERMREAGLLQVDTEGRGDVGRPQHRYSLSEDAPALGLEPSPFPMLARVLLEAAAEGAVAGEDLLDAARRQGRADAARWTPGSDPVTALVAEQSQLGFDPAVVVNEGSASMAFAHCPFRALAEAHPELVCRLHCGLVEGVLDHVGRAEVSRFHSVVDRTPCQVDLVILDDPAPEAVGVS